MKHLNDYRFFSVVAKSGSIRKAADKLSITSTALNRRIIALEDEIGEKLFERLSSGVRLSAAGELFLNHVQKQLAEFDGVKSQIQDLRGVKRGHVNIACSQALLTSYFPQQIALFRQKHPEVTFSVFQRDRTTAEALLLDNSVDLAMIFEPIYMPEMKILFSKEQQLFAIMSNDHPLSKKEELRLSDCADYHLALPKKGIGVREIVDFKANRSGLELKPCVESDSFEFLRNHCMNEGSVTFQIEIGIPQILEPLNLVARPLSKKSIKVGSMYLIQKKDRILPVATALFSEQLINSLLE